MSLITVRQASDVEKQHCQSWEIWQSGDVERFEYFYDQDVQFIVQSGIAVIHSQESDPVAIQPGCHVIICKGVQGCWEIKSPIVNRYQYL